MAGIGHIAVGLAAGRIASRISTEHAVLARAMLAFSVLSMLPDLDVLAFVAGIPYEAPLGHRGASHSLALALVGGVLFGSVGENLGLSRLRASLLGFLVLASHGLLDTLTDGGRGVALLWPFSSERFFAPWRPIPVSPIGPAALLTSYGLSVIATELLGFSPFFLYALWPRRRRKNGEP
ncbi:metal-dependent hydrolase [bacterium]|nr:metal-dependent hydrolase [bacterium]